MAVKHAHVTSIPNITILELFTIISTKTKHKYING